MIGPQVGDVLRSRGMMLIVQEIVGKQVFAVELVEGWLRVAPLSSEEINSLTLVSGPKERMAIIGQLADAQFGKWVAKSVAAAARSFLEEQLLAAISLA